jgi:outer membrane protein TolC
MYCKRTSSQVLILLCLLLVGTAPAWAEQVTFQRAIQLALTHSPAMGIASADQRKAERAYQETRSAYLPTLVFGSGLGWSYGYPLSIEGSAPSIFNVNYQSALYNPAVNEFIKSAKMEWHATANNSQDQRKDVILDTAVSYIQLDKMVTDLKSLKDQETNAGALADIVSQRVQQGVDSQVELTKAKLVAARVRLSIAEMEGNADLLRNKLSQLTGLPAASIETVSDSVPKLPEFDQESDLASKALENSAAVKAAEQRAQAQQFKARGEHKALYPSFDLVGQYGLFARFNNFEDFFRTFQRNNATVGVSIKFPIFNFVQKAHAEQADADVIKANRQVDAVKGQVSAETLRLQRSVRQLAAAQQVSDLEYQLAKSEAEATQIRAETGGVSQISTNAPAGAGAVTARDVANARIQASAKYSQYLNTTLEYDKTRLQLLRAIGELENWAIPAK